MAAGDYPVRDATGAIIPLSKPYASRFDTLRIPRASARAAILGTSITEMMSYRQASANATANGDGTWTVTFASTPRPSFAENDVIKTTQGPVGFNSYKTLVVSINTGNNTMVVMPNLNYPINLTGSLPFCYSMNERQKNGYMSHAEILAAGRFEVVIDAAIGGCDTSNLIYSFPQMVGNRVNEFDFIVAEMGTMNDVYARTWTYAKCIEQCGILLDMILATGKPFIIFGCLPRDSANGAWTQAKLNIVLQVNSWLATNVRANGGVFIDPYKSSVEDRTYMDFNDANADPVASMTDDSVHSNQRGGFTVAPEIVDVINTWFPPFDPLPFHAQETNSGMLNLNPLMLGTGGSNNANGTGASMSGSVATDTVVFAQSATSGLTVVSSLVARTVADDGDAIGQNQRIVLSASSGTHIVEIRFGQNAMHSLVTNGDTLEAMCAVRITKGTTPGVGEPVGLRNASLVLNTQTNTTTNHNFSTLSTGNSNVATPKYRGTHRIVGKVPAPNSVHGNPTMIRASIWLVLNTGCDVCVDLGRAAIYKNRRVFAPI